jgi:hypothetical protein
MACYFGRMRETEKREDRQPERPASPTVTFYNGDQAIGNAMGSMADREGNNSGRKKER